MQAEWAGGGAMLPETHETVDTVEKEAHYSVSGFCSDKGLARCPSCCRLTVVKRL